MFSLLNLSTIGIVCVMSILTSYVIYIRNNRNKLIITNQDLVDEVECLRKEKETNLLKIQELVTTLELLQQRISNDNAYKDSFENFASQTIMKLGSQLNKQLIDSYNNQSKNVQLQSENQIKTTTAAIINHLEKLSNSTKVIEKEVEKSSNTIFDLRRSLSSSASIGSFTEITLQNILLNSGLQKNIDFFVQLVLERDGKTYRPDVVIKLPENNFVIIDAKSSKFFIESELAEKKSQQNYHKSSIQIDDNFIKAMNNHMKNLVSKEYHMSLCETFKYSSNKNINVTSVMFLHSESIIEKINHLDTSFLRRAWDLNIFPVGPTGLMNVISMAKSQINQYKQSKNYDRILVEIKDMLNSLSVLSEHANKLGSSIQSLTTNYDRFAASFNHNFLSKSNKISSFGIKGEKLKANAIDRYQLSVSKTNIVQFDNVDKKSVDLDEHKEDTNEKDKKTAAY